MLNRFSTVGTSEYTPQHVPLPFDTISKLGEQVKLEHDTADAEAAKWKTDIQGGLATQEHAKALNAKKNALLAEAQARAEKTNNYGRLTQDIKEIASAVQNDPLYQGIQRDIAQTKKVNEQRADPNLPYVVQNYADEKGNVKQLGVDQPFDESYYSQVAPVDFYKDHSDVYNQIKEQSIKQGGPSTNLIYRTTYDAAGNELIQGFNQQNQKVREGIAPEDVAAFADRWIQDPRNMATRASVGYRDAYLKQKENRGYTPQEYRQDIINNFPGYREKITDVVTEKPLPIENAPKDGSGGSGGGSGKVKAPIPNAYTGLLTTDTVVDEHLDGLFRPNEDGSHTVPLQGSIINFAKVSNATPEEDKVITWGQQVYNLKKKMGYVNDPVTVVANLEKKDAAGNYYSPNNSDIYRKDNKTGAVTLVGTVEDLANKAVKDTPQYKFLKESASQEGLDIDSPEFQQTYKKGLGKFTEETIDELGKILEIGGEAKFVVDEGKNKMNVDNKPFLSGKAIMTESELNLAFDQVGKGHNDWDPTDLRDDWEDVYLKPDGAGYGAIKPSGSVTKDGKTEQLYSIDLKKEIPVSRAVNKTYNKNVYTESYTANANSLDQSYDEFANNQLSKQDLSVYNAMYTKDKKAFDENLNQLLEYNKGIYTPKLTKILADINAEKDPNKKKQAMIQFSLKLKNGEVEEMINGIDNFQNSTQPAAGGKSQGGWSQTPATPLKK
jgi:hypothetical protein